ncbi:MAG: hypothetical protein ACRDNS_29745, partial [Trebonia sp.]
AKSANKIAKLAESIKGIAGNVTKSDAQEEVENLVKEAEGEHSSFLDYAKDLGGSGSRSTGQVLDGVTALAQRLPDNAQVAQALKILKPLATKNAATFLSGTTVDASDKVLSQASPLYNHLKDDLTYALPADMGIPVVSVAETWTPADFIVHETELAGV